MACGRHSPEVLSWRWSREDWTCTRDQCYKLKTNDSSIFLKLIEVIAQRLDMARPIEEINSDARLQSSKDVRVGVDMHFSEAANSQTLFFFQQLKALGPQPN